jgi:hypothetical protein
MIHLTYAVRGRSPIKAHMGNKVCRRPLTNQKLPLFAVPTNAAMAELHSIGERELKTS